MRVTVGVGLLLGLAGCPGWWLPSGQLVIPDVACTDDLVCRSDIGVGFVCGASGMCEAVAVPPRCAATYPEDLLTRPDKYPDAIVFGSLLDHGADPGDLLLVHAATLAILHANSSGLEGRPFGVVHCDYRDDPDLDDSTRDQAAVDGAAFLVGQLGVPVLLGPGTPNLVEQVYFWLHQPENAAPDTLMISSSASSDALSAVDISLGDAPGLLWRTTQSDAALGASIATRMELEGVTAAIVLHGDDADSVSLSNALETAFDGTVLRQPFPSVDPDALADAVHTLDINNGPFDGLAVVFLGPTLQHNIDFLAAASAHELYTDDRVPLYLADPAHDERLIDDTADLASSLFDRLRIAVPIVDTRGPAYDSFESAYITEFAGLDPSASVYASAMYDAAWLAVYGAAWAHYQRDGALGGRDLAHGLQQISDPLASMTGCAVPIAADTWPIVRACFEDGLAIDVRGASGDLDYDPATEELVEGAAEFFSVDPDTLQFTCLTCDA